MLKGVELIQSAKVFVKDGADDKNIYVEYLGEFNGISFTEVLTIPISEELLTILNRKFQKK